MSYSTWTATLTYNDGSPQTINLHAFGGENLIADITKTEQLYNNLKPVQDVATIDVLFRTSLANTLIQIDPSIVVSVTIQKDASDWFVGQLRPVEAISTDATPASTLTLEVIDNSERLKSQLAADYTATDVTVSAAVTALLTAAGYGASEYNVPTISDTIRYILEQAHETTYIEVIEDILYSYGRTFYFDASGVFQVYQWGAAGTPSATGTISHSNMVGDLQAERNVEDKTGVEVVWYDARSTVDYVLHSSPPSGVINQTITYPTNTADIPTATTRDYDLRDEETFGKGSRIIAVSGQKIRFTYDEFEIWCPLYIPFTNLCAVPAASDWRPRGPFESTGSTTDILTTISFGGASATVQFTAPGTQPANQKVRNLAYTISGTVEFAEPQPPVVLGTRAKVDKIDGRYLYTRAAANNLANAIRSRQTNGKYIYRVGSESSFTVGQYVTLTSGVTGLNISQTARVVARSEVASAQAFDGNTVYSYVLEGVGAVGSTATTVTDGTVAITSRPPAPGAPAPTTPPITGSSLGTNDDPGESGLYMTNRFLGMYEQDKQWIVVIENDAGVGKLRVGFGDKYINWDGADLTIQGDVRSGNFVTGVSGWEILNNGNAEFNDVVVRGTIEATTGDIGGWEILANEIRSANDLTRIRADRNRLQIDDSLSTVKVALGYLGDVPGFTSDDFGLYVADGNSVSFSSGASFEEGSYLINSDAAFVAQSGGAEAVRLGSLGGGDIGLDIGGMSFGDTLGGGGATGTFGTTLGGGTASSAFTTVLGGGNALYGTASGLLYSLADDRLFLTGTLVGVDGEFSGSLKAATGTFTGALSAATGTFAGLVSGGSIDIGAGQFTVDAAGDVVANNIDIAGGTISGSITATGTITGGTISGASITGGSASFNGGTGSENVTIQSGQIKVTNSGGDIAYLHADPATRGVIMSQSGFTAGVVTVPLRIKALTIDGDVSSTQSESLTFSTGLAPTSGSVFIRESAGGRPELVFSAPAYGTAILATL